MHTHINDHNSPNIQTSLAEVNLLKLIDSGAIHLIGSLPLEAEAKTNTDTLKLQNNFYNYITFVTLTYVIGDSQDELQYTDVTC